MRIAYLFLMLIGLGAESYSVLAQTQFQDVESPDRLRVIQAIQWLQVEANYNILYRESDVDGLWIHPEPLQSVNEYLEELKSAFEELAFEGLIGLKWDDQRNQIILYAIHSYQGDMSHQKMVTTSFQVLDNETGEPLPYAQIAYRWDSEDEWKVIPSAKNGRFNLSHLPNESRLETKLEVEAHHIGYQTFALPLPITADIRNYTIRLTPEEIQSNEMIIWGDATTLSTNQVYRNYVRNQGFGSLGETHTTRNLQQLASVGLNGAISEGVFVRGSDPTGFRVYLDQQQIYHDHHMFGLMDAMNSEALQTAGFYYSFIPARYSSPTGGLLDLNTRSGNRQSTSVSTKLSNSAYSLTAHGPLYNRKSSWLLSARTSIYSTMPQLSKINAIEYGLNINRPYSLRSDRNPNRTIPLILPYEQSTIDDLSHYFMDLHGKWTMDINERKVLSVSFYKGQDDSRLSYSFPNTEFPNTLYNATYYWDADHAVINYIFETNSSWIVESKLGLSAYTTRFLKEDYEYQVNELYSLGYSPGTVAPLSMSNDVQDFNLKQIWNTSNDSRALELGWSYTDYQIAFSEQSLVIPSFISNSSSQLLEVFGQLYKSTGGIFESTIGLRGQYYSNGQKLRWNPSLKLQAQPSSSLSVFFSLVQSHQFTHKLELYNQKSLDFWILTQENQRPSKVTHWNLGLELGLHQNLQYRTEAYIKNYSDLRLHQLNAGLLSSLYSSNSSTWLNESDGQGLGWEHYLLWDFNNQEVVLQYTWAEMILRTPNLLNGEAYAAPWDRRHQLHLGYEGVLINNILFGVQGMFGTGTPNIYGDILQNDGQRLPNYLRFDLNVSHEKIIKSFTLTTQISIFNLTNRQNVWYIDRVKALLNQPFGSSEVYPQREVYDLGIYPSFSFQLRR